MLHYEIVMSIVQLNFEHKKNNKNLKKKKQN